VPIRYVRDGLRVVRAPIPPPAPPAPEPNASPPLPLRQAVHEELLALRQEVAASAITTRGLAQRLRAFARGLEHDLARRARLNPLPERADGPGGAASPRASTRLGVTGSELLRVRRLLALSQRAVAEQLRCSRSAIAEAERGRRPVLPHVAAWVRQTAPLADAGDAGGDAPQEARP
jgi:hypothetical protein